MYGGKVVEREKVKGVMTLVFQILPPGPSAGAKTNGKFPLPPSPMGWPGRVFLQRWLQNLVARGGVRVRVVCGHMGQLF